VPFIVKTLALDFSAPLRSVALVSAGTVLARATRAGDRMTNVVAMVEEVLTAASLRREAIDRLAVGLGPGSYTGMRAAISFTQGWQLARPVEVCGLRSVDVLAAQAHQLGWRGPLHVVVDAQRQELYIVSFAIEAAGPRETLPLRILSLAETRAHAAGDGRVAGPEATKWFPNAEALSPDAGVLGLLAEQASVLPSGQGLEPVYLRETTFVKAPPPRPIPPITS